MLRTVIVEDEIDAQSLLARIFLEYCEDIDLVGIVSNIEDARKLIEREQPDLIFLDIQLEDGSGFELLDGLSEVSAKIIFTTAFDNYAIRAFKYEAIDYVLKPYSPKDILASLERVRKTNFDKDLYFKLNQLFAPKDEIEKISINTNEGVLFINIIDIIRLEADRSYCHIYLEDNEKILVSKPMGKMIKRMPKEQFIKVHLSHTVNVSKIKQYVNDEGGYILMDDGTKVPVSRRRKQEILKILQ